MGYRKAFYNLIETLKELVLAHYSEELVTFAIFGSVARDTFRPDSDIDILIIAKELPEGAKMWLSRQERWYKYRL